MTIYRETAAGAVAVAKAAPMAVSTRAVRRRHEKTLFRKIAFILALAAAIVLVTGVIITLGPLEISFAEVYAVLIDGIWPGRFEVGDQVRQVVWRIRLPRLAGAVVAGFGFGICGCAMQAVLMNPLASPFTLGISAGAQFGVAFAAVFGLGFLGGPYLLIGNAFVFAMACSIFIMALSLYRGATSETLVLAGIAVNYFFTALSSLFKYFATDEQLRLMVSWGMGDLAAFSWTRFPLLLALLFVCVPLLWLKGRDLNIMTVGEESAQSLGINTHRVRIETMTLASLLVAAIVCFTGTIGFIGLVAPHMARLIIGVDHKYLMIASGMLGALILLVADAIGMNAILPTVIPTGIMTALLGVPFFIGLILRGKRKEYWR
jgi:iron complex transport system permease protein